MIQKNDKIFSSTKENKHLYHLGSIENFKNFFRRIICFESSGDDNNKEYVSLKTSEEQLRSSPRFFISDNPEDNFFNGNLNEDNLKKKFKTMDSSFIGKLVIETSVTSVYFSSFEKIQI